MSVQGQATEHRPTAAHGHTASALELSEARRTEPCKTDHAAGMGQLLRKQGRQTEASRKPVNKEKCSVVSQAERPITRRNHF